MIITESFDILSSHTSEPKSSIIYGKSQVCILTPIEAYA